MISDTSQMLYHEWLLLKEKELREEKEAKNTLHLNQNVLY